MTLMGLIHLSIVHDSMVRIYTMMELNISFSFHSFVVSPFQTDTKQVSCLRR